MRCRIKIKRLLTLILVSIELIGCQPLRATPIPTPEIWQIQRTPTLAWLSEGMDSCARQQRGIGLIVEEIPAQDLSPTRAVFSLRWGAPSELKSAAVVGFDNLVIIVHPENRVTQLQLGDIRSIYGRLRFWKAFSADGTPIDGEIKPWTYPPGQDTQQVFQLLVGQALPSNVPAGYAPDPSAMRQAVASDVNAIGYLPARWLDSTVRALEISGASRELIRQPVLALYSLPPKDAQKAWLVCLQAKISPGK